MEAAAEDDSDTAGPALAQLCEAYWFPLYAFVRRMGNDRAKAEDLTQAFFAMILEKNRLAKADPERGRFRTFLLSSFKNFVANKHRDENTQKRGGEHATLSFDFDSADQQYLNQPTDLQTPEKIFDRSWALLILKETLAAVRMQYEESDKLELFLAIQSFLGGDNQNDNDVSYSTVAEQLAMSDGAIRVAVHRLRQRYGDQIRLQIARTVEDPKEVEIEIRELFQALG